MKGFLPAVFGMFLLATAYGIIGCCLWPCIGALVDKKVVGKAYGLAYATQQVGLTVANFSVGVLNDNLGYYYVEAFFVICCGLGLLCSGYLLKTIGKNLPVKKEDEPEVISNRSIDENAEAIHLKNAD